MRRASNNPPTFALLREKRRLRVRNPENGARFTISLRDWQEMLWAVRVHPEPQWRQPANAYTTAHRILPRMRIEIGFPNCGWSRPVRALNRLRRHHLERVGSILNAKLSLGEPCPTPSLLKSWMS